MILTHKLDPAQLEEINKKLLDKYGRSQLGRPNFRVVWSDDQFEKRITKFTNEGFELLLPEVRILPKYKPMISERYLLERLSFIPDGAITDLVENFSYEPIWNFQSAKGTALVPTWPACHWIIESLMENMKPKAPYKNIDDDPEMEKARLDALMEDLYGNETDVTDALRYKEGIVVPRSYES